MSNSKNWRPSGSQWGAIGSAALTVGVVAGPVGAGLTALGGAAGACAANALGWNESSEGESSRRSEA